jgi:methionine sulfoxide reductase catalytic subunit
MLIKTNANGFIHPVSSEITSAEVYQSRRELLRLMAGRGAKPWRRAP